MTIAHSARKIIKTQRFIFRALPAVFAGLSILTACGGGALPNAPLTTPTKTTPCDANSFANGCENTVENKGISGEQPPFSNVLLSVDTTADDTPRDTDIKEVVVKQDAPKPLPPTPNQAQNPPQNQPQNQEQNPPAPVTSTDYVTYVSPVQERSFSQSPPSETDSQNAPDSAGASGESSDNPVTATTWTGSFTDLPTARDAAASRTDISDVKNQFLAGEATKLPAAGNLSRPLTLGNAQYDGSAIGGESADGVDFFATSETIVERDENRQVTGITTTRYHYAGILSNTDLGAPFLTSAPTAKWRGSFKTYNMNPTDFLLTVEFGTTDATRKISAFVKDDARSKDVNYYHVTGNYNSAGVITGKVNWGTFSDITTPTATGGRAANGLLTGLIGADGAVGAFVSGDSVDASGKVTGGTGLNVAQGWGNIGYAGGFVAGANVANNPNITFSDWTDSFTNPPSNTLNTEQRSSQFLAGGSSGLNPTGAQGQTESITLNLSDSTFEEERLGGQSAYGVSVFYDSETSHFYAGLLRGTDLGAPLATTVKQAFWHGQFQTIGDGFDVNTDFALEIGFDDGSRNRTVEAFVKNTGSDYYPGIDYYHLKGTFDDNGVITGTVDHGSFLNIAARTPLLHSTRTPGILTGLIGENGAVGVFIAGTGDKNTITGDAAYVGGFVAVPKADTVTYHDWMRSFSTLPPINRKGTGGGEFLATREHATEVSGTNAGGYSAHQLKTLTTNTATFDGASLSEENFAGVSFLHNINTIAGILHDTDLGAPLRQTSGKVFWYGQFQTIGLYSVNTDFTLEIDFDNNLAVEAFVKRSGNNYFHLRGKFDDKGVITGTVVYDYFIYAGKRSLNLYLRNRSILTGLIGEKGAVGVFIQGTGDKNNLVGSPSYAGGFVAVPNPLGDSDATFSDWSRSFPAPPSTRLDRGTPRHQFLAVGALLDTTGSIVVTSGSLNIDEATFEGLERRTAYNSGGVEFFVGSVNGTRYGYAGLLPSADVGSPSAISATYKGQFRGILFNNGITAEMTTDFILTTDLTNRTLSFNVANTFNDGVFVARDVAIDENGVFSGSITHDRFGIAIDTMNRLVINPAPDTVGSLSGIIGGTGVIGMFYGGAAATNSGFVGGFTAIPSSEVRLNPRRVAFSDWVSKNFDWRSSRPSTLVPFYSGNDYIDQHTRLNTTTRSNQFLAGGGATLDETGAQAVLSPSILNLSIAYHDSNRIGGDSRDGVAFFSDVTDNGTYYYAGLLSGTDLGAPLTENAVTATVLYKGQISAIGAGARSISSDLTVHLHFYKGLNNGNVAYINAGVGRYYLNGTIDTAGVITGGAKFTPENGTAVWGPLSGLISGTAAVGAFHSGAATGANGFAGGFAALHVITAAGCNQSGLAYQGFCQDIPLHLNEIANFPTFLSSRGISLYAEKELSDIHASCGDEYCNVRYPDNVLNIRPLNDSNTGMGKYTGQWQYAAYQGRFTRRYPHGVTYIGAWGNKLYCIDVGYCDVEYYGLPRNIDQGLSIDVDFKLKTFQADGWNINGSFTDRGIITGSVTTRGRIGDFDGQANTVPDHTMALTGYIGQDVMVGFFGGARTVSHHGAPALQRRAGGFILNRDSD